MNINSIEEKVCDYIRKHDLLHSGDCILTAVSGGADSVCLLLILHRLQERLGIRLKAVTVNHGIRGTSAEADVHYVENLCGRYGIPLHICQVSVPEFLRQHSMSEEEAARKLRYQCFAETAKQVGATAVAVAHHREDHCETVLHHLFRGSSLRGLKGMEPLKTLHMETGSSVKNINIQNLNSAESDSCFCDIDERKLNRTENVCDEERDKKIWKNRVDKQEIRIIRPLLELSRQDIEIWLEEQEVPWQTDETNLTDAYTRNRLRHQIIPLITEQINTQAVPHILQAAKDICEAQELVEELAWNWLSVYGVAYERQSDQKAQLKKLKLKSDERPRLNKISIPVLELHRCRPIVQREILIQVGRCLTGESDFKDVGRVHLDMILSLAEKGTSKRLELPAGLQVRTEYENLIFSSTDRKKECQSDRSVKCLDEIYADRSEKKEPPLAITVADGISPKDYEFRIFLYNNDKKIPENNYTKWFDYDRIKNRLSLRMRRTGDYFLLDGGGRKSVKSYMIDKKIPAAKRNQIPVLADGNHVLWLADGRISAAYKVTEQTEWILELILAEQDIS